MSEQMRKEFEEWYSKLPDDLKSDVCSYSAYKGWQASRQALVVELSKLPEASYSTAGTCYMSDVESALDKAGVSYK
jgi:hypothetical protein